MTDKLNTNITTTDSLTDDWLNTPRLKPEPSLSLQQRIISQAKTLEQEISSPKQAHSSWYKKRLSQLSSLGLTKIAVPVGLAACAMFAVVNLNPSITPNGFANPPMQAAADEISETEWQAYFLLEDELLLSSL